MLGELWIDTPSMLQERLKLLPDPLRGHVSEFAERGFTVFPGLISPEDTDRIVADTRKVYGSPQEFVVNANGTHIDPADIDQLAVGQRILDLFAVSGAARDAIGHPTLVSFLKTIFDDDVLAMQSLYFEYGSQQAVHQDTAYVVSRKPLNLAAAWIALEDVTLGAGELIYYPGSHRFDHFLFSDAHKHWRSDRDGDAQHHAFLESLHEKARASGMKQEAFLARKGDVLIWHADLAHGGGAITVPGVTRQSLVAHYCPKSVKPAYRNTSHPYYCEAPHIDGLSFTSAYYDLRKFAWSKPPAIVFDGGLERKTPLPTVYRSVRARVAQRVPNVLKRGIRSILAATR